MQRFLWAALCGLVVPSLMSCGGTEVDATEATKQLQLESAVRHTLSTSVKNAHVMAAGGTAGAPNLRVSKIYIVQLIEPAVVVYEGGISSYAATRPARGNKFDANTSAVTRYRAYLQSRHQAMLESVGATQHVYSYAYAFNGFAAALSEGQALKLASTP